MANLIVKKTGAVLELLRSNLLIGMPVKIPGIGTRTPSWTANLRNFGLNWNSKEFRKETPNICWIFNFRKI